MTFQPYGNFCGVARAFEILGARWSALIVRDLVMSPKTLAELQEALPGSTTADLGARLDELEAAGVVTRSGPTEGDGTEFELTDYGRDFEPVLLQIGRWGARSLGDPRPGQVFTLDMALMALRATFRPEHARGLRLGFEVWFGPMVVHAKVDDGDLVVAEGELPDADLVVSSQMLRRLMAAELSPADALWLGVADAKGDPDLLNTFVQLFHIQPAPELPEPAGAQRNS